ncbi:DUF1349 domain-containing protein [Streptomyces sp. NPDC059718]
MNEQRPIDWDEATWLNTPQEAAADGSGMLVTTRDSSDFWRTTAYGFVRDDGHALLTAFPGDTSMEVTFRADFDTLYDQAGLMIRVDAENWVKAGIEMSDGVPHLGAVVTRGVSDWSLAPVPDWAGHAVTVRASRSGDAVTIRARRDDGPWRLVRLAPLAPDAAATAGPFCCSPERAGLRVAFTGFTRGAADSALHVEPQQAGAGDH